MRTRAIPGAAVIAVGTDHTAAASAHTVLELFREHHVEPVHLAVVMVGDLDRSERCPSLRPARRGRARLYGLRGAHHQLLLDEVIAQTDHTLRGIPPHG